MDTLINIAGFLAVPIGCVMVFAGLASIGKDDAKGIALSMIGALVAGLGFVILRS